MKKLFTSIVLTTIAVASASAQIANGFYYVKNRHTGRYMSIQDNDPNHYKVSTTAGDANLAGIRTYSSWSDVCTMPSCVIYVKRVSGNQYDFEAQGSSLPYHNGHLPAAGNSGRSAAATNPRHHRPGLLRNLHLHRNCDCAWSLHRSSA